MKKIIGIVACAALVASSAFAGVNVGAWGRSGVNLLNATKTTETDKDDVNTKTVEATPSWANGSRVGVNFSAASEDGNIGFNLNLDSNGATAGIGDQAKVWGKIGWFEVEFGKIQLDDLRGSVGDWGNRDIGSKGEDDIFDRFYPSKGMTVELRPIDGLFIGAALNTSASTAVSHTDKGAATYTKTVFNSAKDGTGSTTTVYTVTTAEKGSYATESSSKAEDVFKAIQVGVGYTIADVAQLKAAYFGSARSFTVGTDSKGKAITEKEFGKIDLGVDLLFLKGNTIEIGAKIPLFESNKARMVAYAADGGESDADNPFAFTAADNFFNVIVGVKGGVDKLGYKGHVYSDFAPTTKQYTTTTEYAAIPRIGLDAGVEYDLGIVALGLTAKYNIAFYSESGSNSQSVSKTLNNFGAELYAKKAFSNGYLFAGVADDLSATALVWKNAAGTYNYKKTTNTFSIPVGAEYWF